MRSAARLLSRLGKFNLVGLLGAALQLLLGAILSFTCVPAYNADATPPKTNATIKRGLGVGGRPAGEGRGDGDRRRYASQRHRLVSPWGNLGGIDLEYLARVASGIDCVQDQQPLRTRRAQA